MDFPSSPNAALPPGARILVCIILEYSDHGDFWFRDTGLMVSTLRKMGYDAKVVALTGLEAADPELPLVLTSLNELESESWWKNQRPDAAVLFTWSAPRYDKVRKAALAVTPRVLEKLDTDGVRSPRVWWWKYLYASWGSYRDTGTGLKRLFAGPMALGRFSMVSIFPGLLDRKMARTMAQLPMLAAETPIAAERIRRFIRQFAMSVPKVVCIPHAVQEEYVRYDPLIGRENVVVAVGRWKTTQKNFPMLLRVLKSFLQIHSSWNAEVVGELPKGFASESQEIGPRIRFRGRIAHQEIVPIYQRAKIFFMPSRWESFNIAAAEALCCGCSVVGSADIASVPFFASKSSGSLACRPCHDHFLDALCAEESAWREGERNPERMAGDWNRVVGATAVMNKLIDALNSMPVKTSV